MKYMVMECHQAYAVLMDEDSRFVHAANLHYKVGQIVKDPVIMENTNTAPRNIRMIVTAAAAACLVLFGGTGYHYYASNFRTHSTIVISTEANITMELNKKGQVLSLKSDTESGREILKNYNGKGKDKSTVANDLIRIEKEKGLISEDDNVKFYVSSSDPDSIGPLQDEMNNIKAKLDITEEITPPPPPEVVPPAENKQDGVLTPPAPVTPAVPDAPAAPKAAEGPIEPPKAEHAQPNDPPAPEPPKAEEPAEHKAETAPEPLPPAEETPGEANKLPHENNGRPVHENRSDDNPGHGAGKNEHNVIHKPHERLTIVLPEPNVPVPEADNNGPRLSEPLEAVQKADDESPLPDLN